MATNETVQIDLLINTAKSAKNLTDTKKALQDMKNQLSSIGKDSTDFKKLSEAISDTTLKAAGAANTFRDMRSTLKDVKDAMELLGPEDKNFTKLNAAAGKLDHQMKLVNDSIKYTSGTPLKNLSAGFTGIRDSLLTGDFEEMGVASKALGNSLLQLAKGALQNITDRFKSFGKGSIGIFKSLGKVMKGDFKGGLDTAKGALKDFGDALKVNPIFLIASAVTLIIANFDKLKTAGGIVGKVFSAIGDSISYVINLGKKLTDMLGLTSFALQKSAEDQLAYYAKVGEEEDKSYSRKEKLQKAEMELAKAKTKNKKEEFELVKKQAQQEYDLEIDHLAFQKVSVTEQIKAIEKLREANGTLTDEQKKQLEELRKSLDDLDNDVKIATDKYKTAIITANKDIAKDDEEKRKKASEARKKEEEEKKKDAEEFQAIRTKISEEGLTENQKARKEIENGYNEEKSKLDDLLKKKAINQKQYYDTLQSLDKQSKDAIAILDKKSSDEKNKKEEEDAKTGLKTLEDSEKLKVDATSEHSKERVAAEEKAMDDILAYKIANSAALGLSEQDVTNLQADEVTKRKQLEDDYAAYVKKINKEKAQEWKKYFKQVEALTSDSFSVLESLNDTFAGKSKEAAKQQFEINKKLQLANAVVSGAEAVVGALGEAPYGPENIAQAAVAGAMAIANIAKISKTTFDSGGSGGSITASPSSSGGFSAQPLMNSNNQAVFQNAVGAPSQTSSNAGGSNPNNNPTVVQAYVTSSDIQNATNKSTVLTRRSKF